MCNILGLCHFLLMFCHNLFVDSPISKVVRCRLVALVVPSMVLYYLLPWCWETALSINCPYPLLLHQPDLLASFILRWLFSPRIFKLSSLVSSSNSAIEPFHKFLEAQSDSLTFLRTILGSILLCSTGISYPAVVLVIPAPDTRLCFN
jgi:hypothetical protein